jgi:catechol 2,3-dioxygenase-like lactoylglutathione lyase family enzyme
MAYRWTMLTAIIGAAVLMTGCNTATQSDARRTGTAANRNAVRFEHVALNVADPINMAKWYVDNLGMKVLREGPAPINARFLADSGGNMMLELYHNPPDAVPNYAAMDPLLLHMAFMVDDVDAVRQKLIAAGATPAGEVTTTPAGDRLAMLRDPWGLAIQFLRRADPMLPVARPASRL